MTVVDRVRKYRDRLQEQHRARLEVSVGVNLIAQVRALARSRKVPVWSMVQDALIAYIEEYRMLLIEGQRLSNERTHALKLVNVPACGHQIDEYNRKLLAYKERLARFYQPGWSSPGNNTASQ